MSAHQVDPSENPVMVIECLFLPFHIADDAVSPIISKADKKNNLLKSYNRQGDGD